MLFGGAKPLGTMQNVAVFQFVSVYWPKVRVREEPLNTGLLQRKPEAATHDVPSNDALLNTPSSKSAPSTTAIIRMAHPYVIRYSIALCALYRRSVILLYGRRTISMPLNNIRRKV